MRQGVLEIMLGYRGFAVSSGSFAIQITKMM
jgi:hypothetical protein